MKKSKRRVINQKKKETEETNIKYFERQDEIDKNVIELDKKRNELIKQYIQKYDFLLPIILALKTIIKNAIFILLL